MDFSKRRQKLFDLLPAKSIAILPAAPEQIRTGDSHYPFRQNSDFHYLTGFPEPEAVAVLITGHPKNRYLLFNRAQNPAEERWTGSRAGQTGAEKNYHANAAYPIEEFKSQLPELLSGKHHVYFPFSQLASTPLGQHLTKTLAEIKNKNRKGVTPPTALVDLEAPLHALRSIKDRTEIDLLRRAATISAEAHCQAMRACKPDLHEYQIEAEILHTFLKHGARAVAYESIVATGKNACTLHYCDNNAVLKSGELLLIDAGCEYELYASDITRTFPINGHFTDAQRALYEVVLTAQLAGIAAAVPGRTWDTLFHTVKVKLIEGLVDLKILKGSVENLLEQNALAHFYMHNAGHWLGLDTHDVGVYKTGNVWRPFEPGMVLTVEPGLYISPSDHVDKKWWNMGIRIEDDILITPQQPEVLSHLAPKKIADIEKLMNE